MTDPNFYAMVFVAAGTFLFVEVLLLLVYRFRKKRGIDTLSLIANAGAGGCLLFAAWLATIQASLLLLCLAVCGAFLCHTVDQTTRWNA